MKCKIVNLPLPTSRKWPFLGKLDSWNMDLLRALSAIEKPDLQAVFVPSRQNKEDIKRAHAMATHYRFKVRCRPTVNGMLVWVRPPGIDPSLLQQLKAVKGY